MKSVSIFVILASFFGACAPVDSHDVASGTEGSGGDNAGVGGQELCRWQYGDCDGNPANGCETRTSDSDKNCGACGHVCSAPHASMDCDFSVCIVDQCEPGYDDADMDPSNGCEQQLN